MSEGLAPSVDDRGRWTSLRARWNEPAYIAYTSGAHVASSYPHRNADIAVTGAQGRFEWVIGVLNTAAGIEHALMIQYLYAAGSLNDWDASTLVAGIAAEEMGHLLTVQNLLTSLGADPCLSRQDENPSPSDDPFPYNLRPATAGVIAAFVASESPRPSILGFLERWELRRILNNAESGVHGVAINRVAVLYDRLRALFVTEPGLASHWFESSSSDLRQASSDEAWARGGREQRLIVRTIGSVDDAIAAIDSIAAQGEGFQNCGYSHFERFRRLYRGIRCSRWIPAALLRSGNNSPDRLARPWRILGLFGSGVCKVAYGVSGRPGTDLANTRYRLLLLSILKALELSRTDPRRPRLISTLMREMVFVLPALLGWVRRRETTAGRPEIFDLPKGFPPPDALGRYAQLEADVLRSKVGCAALAAADNSSYTSSVIDQITMIDVERRSLFSAVPTVSRP